MFHRISCLQVKQHNTADDGMSGVSNSAILLTIGYLPGMRVDVIPVIQAKGVNISQFQCPTQNKFLLLVRQWFLHRACLLANFFFCLTSTSFANKKQNGIACKKQKWNLIIKKYNLRSCLIDYQCIFVL